MKDKIWFLCLAFVLVITLVIASGPAAASEEISIASNPPGASSHLVSVGTAELIGKNTPMKAAVKPLTGPIVFIPAINDGEYDMGLSIIPVRNLAKMGNMRLLYVSHTADMTPLAVRARSKIHSLEDLKGKRVASNYPAVANVQELITVTLKSGGLTWDDVIPVPVASHVVGLNALKDGRVDATFAMAPTVPKLREVDSSIGVRIIGCASNPADVPGARELLPAIEGVRMKPRAVLKSEIWGFRWPFWWYTSTHMSDEVAYKVVKAVWDNYTEMRPIHPLVKKFDRDVMLGSEPLLPFHPGAVRFFKEKGVWSAELEQKQKKLLGKCAGS